MEPLTKVSGSILFKYAHSLNMDKNFNTCIDHIDFNAFHEFCVSKGELRHFTKGEEFVSIGKVGRYFGFIQSGTLKYVARSADNTEHVMGLVFGEGFVADWPFCVSRRRDAPEPIEKK